MISIFILLFIAVAILAGLGFATVTLISSTQSSLTVQQNQVRLDSVAGSLRNAMSADADGILLPVATDISARLPTLALYSKTTNGKDIVFCPAFSAAGSTSTMTNSLADGSSETFQVDTKMIDSMPYVYRGHAAVAENVLTRLNEMGVVAYMISPQPNYGGNIKCGDVSLASDNFTLLVDGGTVYPVTKTVMSASNSVFVLSPDGSKPSPFNGTDRIVKTIPDVTQMIDAYGLKDVTIKFTGSGNVPFVDFQSLLVAAKGATLRVQPFSAGQVSINLGADPASVPGLEAYLRAYGTLDLHNVSLIGKDASYLTSSFDIGLDAGPSSNVILSQSSLAALRSSGGRLSDEGSVLHPSFGSSSVLYPVVAHGGQVILDGTFIDDMSANTVFSADGGRVELSPSVKASVSSASLLNSARHSGSVSIFGSTLTSAAEPTIAVDRNDGTGYQATPLLSGRRVVTKVCGDGQVSCAASCDTGETAIAGSCSSTSSTSLISSGVSSDLSSFQCGFSTLPLTTSPIATAVCENR